MAQISFSSTPNLVLRLPMWRSRLVLFLIFVGFTALFVRAIWVQGFGNSFYEEKGNKATLRQLRCLQAVEKSWIVMVKYWQQAC